MSESTGSPAAAAVPGVRFRLRDALDGARAAMTKERVVAFGRKHWAIFPVLAVATYLYAYQLDRNGLGNIYYSAAVKSMSESWSAFFFGSIDTSNFITVDKPPAALWVQALSVRVFGFSSWSLLLPEALAGVAAVGVLYATVSRPFGRIAGVAAAVVLATTPITAATVRVNLPDSVLVLLLVLSAWAAMRAFEDGRLRWALASATFVGLAFNVKMLQAYIVLPALAAVFIVAAPISLKRRIAYLSIASVVLLVVSASWMVTVDALPDGSKPYIGGSTDGTVRDLVFGYNGLGRITGDERAGPPDGVGRDATAGVDGAVGRPGAGQGEIVPGNGAPGSDGQTRPIDGNAGNGGPGGAGGNAVGPNDDGFRGPAQAGPGGGPGGANFGGTPGWTRLFNDEIGGQVAWFIPFALGSALLAFLVRGRAGRTDTKRAAVIFWAVWTGTHFVVFSKAQGIFHPYYTSALAPGIAALCGIGLVSAIEAVRRWRWSIFAVVALFAGATVTELALLDRITNWHGWLPPTVLAGTSVALVFVCLATLVPTFLPKRLSSAGSFEKLTARARQASSGALIAGAGVLVLAPALWSVSVLDSTSNGTTPSATPQTSGARRDGPGNGLGVGLGPGAGQRLNQGLADYLVTNRGEAKWIVAVTGAQTAAPIIIQTGEPVMAMGGFSGGDPAPTAADLKAMIASGEIRFFLTGGPAGPGGAGNQGTNSYVASSCARVDPAIYGATNTPNTPNGGRAFGGQALYDCGALVTAAVAK